MLCQTFDQQCHSNFSWCAEAYPVWSAWPDYCTASSTFKGTAGNTVTSWACRVALHLQIASTQSLPQEQQQHNRALVTARPAVIGAVDSIQTRQSSAERDLLAQEQEHRNREASATGPAMTEPPAAAAEAAVLASCEVAQQVLQQLQCLEASTVVGLMVHNKPYCMHIISDCSKPLLLWIYTIQQLLADPLSLQP